MPPDNESIDSEYRTLPFACRLCIRMNAPFAPGTRALLRWSRLAAWIAVGASFAAFARTGHAARALAVETQRRPVQGSDAVAPPPDARGCDDKTLGELVSEWIAVDDVRSLVGGLGHAGRSAAAASRTRASTAPRAAPAVEWPATPERVSLGGAAPVARGRPTVGAAARPSIALEPIVPRCAPASTIPSTPNALVFPQSSNPLSAALGGRSLGIGGPFGVVAFRSLKRPAGERSMCPDLGCASDWRQQIEAAHRRKTMPTLGIGMSVGAVSAGAYAVVGRIDPPPGSERPVPSHLGAPMPNGAALIVGGAF